MCLHSRKKKKIKVKIQHQVDVRVLFHREDQGNDKPQCTPLPPSPPCILHYLHLSTVLDPWPPWHHTEWVSVWSHVNKGIKRQVKLGMERFFCSLSEEATRSFFLNPWGVKQQNSRSFFVTVAVSLAWSSAATQRWTLERDIHKNMPVFCKYPVKTDKRELDMVNVMPFSAVHVPSSQPNRPRRAHHMMSRFKTNSIFLSL